MSSFLNPNSKGAKWGIVAVAFLIMALQYAPGVSLVGLFLEPLEQEFLVGRTAVTTVITTGILGSMVGSLFAGRLLAKFSYRRVMLPGLVVCALCFFLNGVAQSLLQLTALAALRGLVSPLLSIIPISIILNEWFDDGQRGRALGIALVGSGVGAVALTPLTSYIIQLYGWRLAYQFFAVLVLVLVPLVAVFFRPCTGSAQKARPQSEQGEEKKGLSATQALATPMFWAALVGFVCIAGATQVWNNNGVSYFRSVGLTAASAANVFAVGTVGLTVGKVAMGALYDKWGSRKASYFGIGVLLLGLCLLLASGPLPVLSLPAAALTGFGMAVVNIALSLVTGTLFGPRAYGTLVGYMQFGLSLGASLLPLAISAVYDSTGAYALMWAMASGLCVVALLCLGFAFRRHSKREQTAPLAEDGI